MPHDETRLVERKEARYGWWRMKLLRATSKFDVPALKLGSALHMRYRHPVFLVIRYFYLLLVPIGILIAISLAGIKSQTSGERGESVRLQSDKTEKVKFQLVRVPAVNRSF